MRAYALLVLGVFACSTAVIMIKQSDLPWALLASYRLLLAALLLTPVLLHERRARPQPWGAMFRRSFPGAVLLALHMATWSEGARLTVAANASLIVNLVPLVMPVMLLIVVGERISKREVAGSLLALGGVLVLTGFDLQAKSIVGDAICFGSMLAVALYLVVAKRAGAGVGLWSYVVPLYWMAGGLCLLTGLALPSQRPLLDHPWREYALMLGLAVVPTIIGHTTLQQSMRYLRGQVVSVFNLCQFVFAGAMAYVLFHEAPAEKFYLAAAMVLGGAVIMVWRPKPVAKSTAPTAEHTDQAVEPVEAG